MASNKQIEEVGEPREKKPPKMHLMKEIITDLIVN
jgi:hypothetical protein